MENIWGIMAGIAYGFELFGFGMLTLGITVMICNTTNKKLDMIRKFMLMQDEEDFK